MGVGWKEASLQHQAVQEKQLEVEFGGWSARPGQRRGEVGRDVLVVLLLFPVVLLFLSVLRLRLSLLLVLHLAWWGRRLLLLLSLFLLPQEHVDGQVGPLAVLADRS